MHENQSTYIPAGVYHRLTNPGLVPLEIIEIQSGSYLKDNDIERKDDMYGRVNVLDFVSENKTDEKIKHFPY